MTDAEPEPLLVFDNTCLSAFASAHLMPVLKDLTVGYRVGTTEAVREEFGAGPNNVADIAWVDLLPEQGMNELVALAEYIQLSVPGNTIWERRLCSRVRRFATPLPSQTTP